jgi:hypothetical protein
VGKPKSKPVPKPLNGKKQPVIPGSVHPGTGKEIAPRRLLGVHTNSDDDDLGHPLWRLSLLDHEHNGSWSWRTGGAGIVKIVAFLTQMERLTWKEIRTQQVRGQRRTLARHHAQAVNTLCSEARNRLEELGLDDWDELFRFRLEGDARLWGILSNESPRVFYPIWWDPLHQVYPLD